MDIKELNESFASIINETVESDGLIDRIEKFLLKYLETADKTLTRLESYKNPPHNLESAQSVYTVLKNVVDEFRKEFKE